MLDCEATFKLMTTELRFISGYLQRCLAVDFNAYGWANTFWCRRIIGWEYLEIVGASVRVRVVFMTILPLISMEFHILDISLCPEIARGTVNVFLRVPLVH